jgi:choline-sulfatase
MGRRRLQGRQASRPARDKRATGGKPPSSTPDPVFRRRVLALAAVILGVGGAVGLTAWWASGRPLQGRGPGLNVVLITLDTTRADHLGCYGQPDKPTPNIDRLAASGTRFAQCTTAAPSTLPSHATILTAVYPFVHGVRHNVGYRLGEGNATLAEVLRSAGYRTAAYVAAFVLSRDTGLDQGFETYDDAGRRPERTADEVCDGALGWIRRHADESFFLWVHFFDPHFPYEPPPRFRSRFASPYVGEIAFADEQVGRLMAELRRLDLEARTLVVVTSDHGEGLGEHDEETHIFYVYDATMSVPLIFHSPGRIPAGEVVPVQVRHVDIAPTILNFLNIETELALPKSQGTNLIPRMIGHADEADLPAYGEALSGQIVLGTSALRCLRTNGWKYIHAPRPELYNLRADPGETKNLAAVEAERAIAMRAELHKLIADSPQPVAAQDAVVRLDRATRDRLQGLGYVGGDSAVASSALREIERFDPVGEDPKDHAADFAAVGQAIDLLQSAHYAEAEVIYRGLRSRFPGVAELGMQYARSVFLQNRFEEAIAIHHDLAESHPDNAQVHYGLGKLLDRVGRRGEAIRELTTATRLDPGYPEAWYDLGVALSKEGRGVEALECYRNALRARPTYVDARVNLGVALATDGRLDEAIEQYQEALRVAPNDATIHYNLGNAFLRKGQNTEAIEAYDQALRLQPDFGPARQALHLARQAAPPTTSRP